MPYLQCGKAAGQFHSHIMRGNPPRENKNRNYKNVCAGCYPAEKAKSVSKVRAGRSLFEKLRTFIYDWWRRPAGFDRNMMVSTSAASVDGHRPTISREAILNACIKASASKIPETLATTRQIFDKYAQC